MDFIVKQLNVGNGFGNVPIPGSPFVLIIAHPSSILRNASPNFYIHKWCRCRPISRCVYLRLRG